MTNDLLLFIAIGFAAQMVDGAIGMAYGITATTALLSMGVAPAPASAAILELCRKKKAAEELRLAAIRSGVSIAALTGSRS